MKRLIISRHYPPKENLSKRQQSRGRRSQVSAVCSILGILTLTINPPVQAQVLPPPTLGVPSPPSGSIPVIPQTGETYLLGAGDRLQLDIFNVPEYSGPNGQHQVSVDGRINLPLVGGISVQGLTLEQAKKRSKPNTRNTCNDPW